MNRKKIFYAFLSVVWITVFVLVHGDQRTFDNPFSFYTLFAPILLAVVAGINRRTVPRILFVLIAVSVHWWFLQKSVDWAFTHPFNPSDGGPRAFASVFGWLTGLIFIILPVFGITAFLKNLRVAAVEQVAAGNHH